MSGAAPEIVVLPDPDALAAAAADRFVRLAQEAIAARNRFTVALSGGSTPEKMYALLAAPERRTAVPWEKVFFFVGDERFVPESDPASNWGMARRLLLDPVRVPYANRFPMPTPETFADLADAARAYDATLRQFFPEAGQDAPPALDLILLGIGEDGHTASLFPGRPALNERAAWVTGTPPGVLPPPVDRLTLTYPVLNAARHVVFLAGGAKKAAPLKAILKDGAPPSVHPAAGVRPVSGTLTYLLDAAAAVGLNA